MRGDRCLPSLGVSRVFTFSSVPPRGDFIAVGFDRPLVSPPAGAGPVGVLGATGGTLPLAVALIAFLLASLMLPSVSAGPVFKINLPMKIHVAESGFKFNFNLRTIEKY